jgi:YgiT-type zinc finger domain-containing protein
MDKSGETMKPRRNVATKDRANAIETCYFCTRGVLEEKRVTVDFRWGDKLTIIENVPAKVCNECGERYYAAKVVRQMEQLAKEGRKEKELQVPVVSWV